MTTTLLDRARSLFGPIDELASSTAPGEPVADEALRLLAESGLRGLLVPKAAGGLELPLVEVVDLYEEVSRADGSTGWVFFASDACASYFGAYLPDDGMEDLFGGGVPLVAGQFTPNGTARVDGDDLWIDGDYQFGSGIVHATWAGGGVMTVPGEGGTPEYLGVCFPQDAVELEGNWDVLGLQATASYDYRLREVRIPRSHAFDFLAPTVHRGSAVYSLGAITLTALGHAAWALGVTRRVLDELAGMAAGTTRVGASSSLATTAVGLTLFAWGGAMGRPAPDATAFVHRDASWLSVVGTSWGLDDPQELIDENLQWVGQFYDALGPYATDQSYQNFADPALENWQTAYYGTNLPRLVEVKRAYDPENVFTFPQGIPLQV